MLIEKKYIYIGGAIILIIIFFIFIAYMFMGSSSGAKVPIVGKDNKEVKINNIFDSPVEESPGAITFNQTTDLATYFYNVDGNKFTITLNEGNLDDFNAKKPDAEQEFLKLLGVSKKQACNLNVQVVNGGSFDPALQGVIFPLSFCK